MALPEPLSARLAAYGFWRLLRPLRALMRALTQPLRTSTKPLRAWCWNLPCATLPRPRVRTYVAKLEGARKFKLEQKQQIYGSFLFFQLHEMGHQETFQARAHLGMVIEGFSNCFGGFRG